jgi:hypothetical protein
VKFQISNQSDLELVQFLKKLIAFSHLVFCFFRLSSIAARGAAYLLAHAAKAASLSSLLLLQRLEC